MGAELHTGILKKSMMMLIVFMLSACSRSFPDDPLAESILTITNSSFQLKSPLSVTTGIPGGLNKLRLTSGVEIKFNKNMDSSTLTAQTADGNCSGSIQLSSDSLFTNCVAGSISGSGMDWTFTPAISLEEETDYYIRITSDVRSDKSSSNTSLSSNFEISYPTEDLPVLSDLVSWYKTNQKVYRTLPDGANIDQWKNSKSSNNDIGAAGGRWFPEYLSSFRNGRPAVRFVAANNDYFQAVYPSFSPPLEGVTGFTAFLVFKVENISGFGGLLDVTVNGGYNPRFRIMNNAGTLQLLTRKFDADPTDTLGTGTLSNNNYNIAAAYADYTNNETGIFLEDGLTFHSDERSAPAWDSRGGTTCSTNLPRSFLIGQTGIWWQNFDGSIADVVLYNKRLSPQEIESIVCFLGRKYNIAINNPAGCL